MTVAQAKKAGVWAKVSPVDRKDILAKQKMYQHKTQNPQTLLFDALKQHLQEVQSEVKGLVPGKRYRADIYIPSSRIVIEFDGFKYHALHKHGFQKTLERQNLFVKEGYTVLRYYSSKLRAKWMRYLRRSSRHTTPTSRRFTARACAKFILRTY